MNVREWMRDAVAVESKASLLEAEHALAYHGLRQLPVVQGGAVVGLVDEATLAAAHPSPATTLAVAEVTAQLATIPISRVMRPDPPTVGPSTPIADAIRLFRDHDLSILPVVQHDRLVGILVDHDALRAALGEVAGRGSSSVARG